MDFPSRNRHHIDWHLKLDHSQTQPSLELKQNTEAMSQAIDLYIAQKGLADTAEERSENNSSSDEYVDCETYRTPKNVDELTTSQRAR